MPGVAKAYAGADEFLAGFLRGELLEQVAVDCVAGVEVPVGAGDAIAGESLSGELWLVPPTDGGESFVVEGSAEKDGVIVPFAGTLSIDDSVVDADDGQSAAVIQRVRGIPVGGDISEGSTLRVTVDATRWLAGADFSDLLAEVPDAEGIYRITSPNTVWAIWYYQVRQSGTSGPWGLSLEP